MQATDTVAACTVQHKRDRYLFTWNERKLFGPLTKVRIINRGSNVLLLQQLEAELRIVV